MTIFAWRSKAMRQYGNGWLIAQATFAEEARQHILDAAKARRLDSYGCDLDDEEIEAFLALVRDDLAAAPEEHTTLFIPGSE